MSVNSLAKIQPLLIIIITIIVIGYFITQEPSEKVERDYSAIKVLYPNDMEQITTSHTSSQTIQEETPAPSQTINRISICTTNDEDCQNPSPYTNNIIIFWEVENGVGCCNTYNCDYNLFRDVCLEPFRLYQVILDEEDITPSNIEYNCEQVTPYNYVNYEDLTIGTHELTIKQKDCFTLKDIKTVTFQLIREQDQYEIII